MITARAKAPAKINLCLFLGPTRPDGRHELVTVFESLSVADELSVEVLPTGCADEVLCPGVAGPNLALLALVRLREAGWRGPPLRLLIDKHVPVAAGMAGGSADAAAALRLASAVLPAEDGVIARVAAGLGADVPAQVRPGRWLGTGAGEVLEPVRPPAPHAVLVVGLPHALSTAAVFAEADRLGLGRPASELAAIARALRAGPPELEDLVNDLEPATVSLCPEVAEALAALSDLGCDRALVCGSGPTVAGIWWDRQVPPQALAAAQSRFPGARVAHPVGETFGAARPGA